MDEQYMQLAAEEAEKNSITNFKDGGPFGAVIVKDGKIIASAHNTVIESKDPTAHAEVNAIRLAAKKLGQYDLNGCTIYASSEPCPMCLSAIIWSNIKTVYYANTKEETEKIGFRDDMIYNFIKGINTDVLDIQHIENKTAKKTFKDFAENKNKIIY